MIVITVGTNQYPFDRLVRAADDLAELDDVLVQRGTSSVTPARARCIDFLPFDELAAIVHESRLVVTHAGVGSIIVSLSAGRVPIVVPRRVHLGEHIDDHQLQIAEVFSRTGYAFSATDPFDTAKAVLEEEGAPSTAVLPGPLVTTIATYLTTLFAENSR